MTSNDAGGGRVGDARGRIRVGFAGAGGIVRKALAPAVRASDALVLQAVAARDPARAAALEPAGNVHGSYADLIADPDVDLVYVALDNAGHRPWTLAALEAGKHVLCEKPLGITPADLDAMTTAAAVHDRLLVEAFWYRWHPRTRRLEQLLAQGALGPVRSVDSGFSYSGPDRPDDGSAPYRLDPGRGGGGILDVGCYAISAAHLVLGPDLRVVDATARFGPTGVDIEASVTLRAEGAEAAIHCGIAAADRQVLSVVGEAARADLGRPVFSAHHQATDLTITTPDGAVRHEEFAPVDPYRLMIEAVAARLRGEDSFLPGGEHSAQVAATTAAVFAALEPPPQPLPPVAQSHRPTAE